MKSQVSAEEGPERGSIASVLTMLPVGRLVIAANAASLQTLEVTGHL